MTKSNRTPNRHREKAMLSEEDHLLIIGKIENTLSTEQQRIFQEKFATDTLFRQGTIAQTQVLAGIEALEKKAMKDVFHRWLSFAEEQESMEPTASPQEKTKLSISWHYWVAAAIFPLFLLYTFLYFPEPKTAEELFATHYTPLENILTVRNTAVDESIAQGMHYYEEANFQPAIAALKKAKKPDSLVNLYLGISYLAVGKTANAKSIFEANLAGSSDIIREYLIWYLALTYLKEQRYDKAHEKLQLLIDRESADYADNASQLIKEIEAIM
ncbi:MAG: hypothetical protein AAFO69_11645 [Bacteroidota bacterium]